MSAWVPQERHPARRRPLAVLAFVAWIAAAFGLIVVCLKAAGTHYAPWIGAAVFVAAVLLVLEERPGR